MNRLKPRCLSAKNRPGMNRRGRGGGYARGRGRGGGGGGGRGRGGGGGDQRWWDPEWRKQRLSEIRANGGGGRPRQVLDPQAMYEKLQHFASTSSDIEIQIPENYGRDGCEEIHEIARSLRLYSKTYGKGTRSIVVVSKEPLPNYRPEFDHKLEEFEVGLSRPKQQLVYDALRESTRMNTPRNYPSKSLKKRNLSDKNLSELPELSPEQKQAESERLFQRQQDQMQKVEVQRMLEFRKKLPSFSRKSEVLNNIIENQVLVISGETGCGKTTQVPQFILESAISEGRGSECNIICTQPRRISAISVSERVAQERGERIGQSVGYQIRLEARKGNDTKLLFCTTGVLLRRLIREPDLQGVSHVIVDEIHERGMNEDFLLIILRDLLPKRPDLRVILMSATLNADLFAKYFGGAKILHIPGFTHPVEQIYLETFLQKSMYQIQSPQRNDGYRGGRFRNRNRNDQKDEIAYTPELYFNYSESIQRSIQTWVESADKLNLDLIEAAIEYICRNEDEGAILVFLTGWDDISKLHDQLHSNRVLANRNEYKIIPLHGSMPTVNQQQIFAPAPPGVRKIVIATNIAETSITIDDIVYVIDAGKAKEKTYDPVNKLCSLLPAWISKASARQRKGRAGRVRPGKCYHLYPKELYDVQMSDFQLPEILRTPLEELCLQIKSLQLGQVERFLSKALEPPDLLSIKNAIDLLNVIGAFTKDEELTSLGHHLAALPVDPRIGKMILMGATFGCLDSILIIASGLSYRDPFVMPLDKKEVADEVKRRFAAGSRSDHIALLRAYREWQRARAHGDARNFCWHNFLSSNTLEMMEDMSHQFLDILGESGFLGSSFFDTKEMSGRRALQSKIEAMKRLSVNSNDYNLIKAVICAGTFPNVVLVNQGRKRAKFKTKEDGKVDLHPSSVNASENYFPDGWLIYSDKVKSSGIFIRSSTMISDFALLLFGGSIEAQDTKQFGRGKFSMIDGYLNFSASQDVSTLVQDLRKELEMLLEMKFENPDFQLHEQRVVSAAIELI